MEQEDVGTSIKGYTLMEFIGGGSFGRVYKSSKTNSPEFYAIKVIKKVIPGMD
jgi:serine/threonine protein kinase